MKSIDVLAKLFGSINRVKIIRLFLANPEAFFSFQDISRRIGASKQKTRREIMLLKTIGFVKQKSEFVALRPQKNKRLKKIRIHGWRLDELFPLLSGFKNFILDSEPLSRDQLLKRIQKAGHMKLVILSGVFCPGGGGTNSCGLDILVVGDKPRKPVLEKTMREIETEVGKEITYAVFNTQDFLNRLGVYDRFIRDILDYPHEKILDKIGI